MAQVPIAVVAGGSDATRKTIPRLGFAVRDAIDVFARVVRPIRQARTRPRTGVVKDAARFARNAWWSLRPMGALAPGWSARQVQSFGRDIEHDRSDTAAAHTAEYLNYWLRCPAARLAGFEVYEGDTLVGWYVLSRVGRQTRIAGAGLSRATQERWEQVFRLAARAAADDPHTCEVVGTGSTPATRAALAACGFEWRDTAPLFVFDKARTLAESSPILWSAIDDDTAYLYDPSIPYRT